MVFSSRLIAMTMPLWARSASKSISVSGHILNRYIFRWYEDHVLILPRGNRIPSPLMRQERLLDSALQHVLDRFAVHDQPLVWQCMFDCHDLTSQNLRHSSD